MKKEEIYEFLKKNALDLGAYKASVRARCTCAI